MLDGDGLISPDDLDGLIQAFDEARKEEIAELESADPIDPGKDYPKRSEDYGNRAEWYWTAAEVVAEQLSSHEEGRGPHLAVPHAHLMGLSVELALKSFIFALRRHPPSTGRKGHDLRGLLRIALEGGFEAKGGEATSVINLGYFYLHDPGSDQSHGTRYPAGAASRTPFPLPDPARVGALVRRLLDEAGESRAPSRQRRRSR